MNKNGEIIFVEDDVDDQIIFTEILADLNYSNKIIFFVNGLAAYEYLIKSVADTFLIISDISMPYISGNELRDKIRSNQALKLKCIPYLFLTTCIHDKLVIDAFSKSVQGYFAKPSEYGEIKRIIKNMIEYWKDCHCPYIA